MPTALKDQELNRRVRTLAKGEETKHFDMLNLAFDAWGDEEEWRKKYTQPGFDAKSNVLVVEEEGKWAGGGTAWLREAFLRNGKKVNSYMAGDLYVHPDFRGKGVYTTAMEGLNDMARARGAVLAFAFPSIYRLPSIALRKYGFVNMFYPKTRILILNPEKFLLHIISDVKEAFLPTQFEGMTVKLTVRFDSPQGKRSVVKVFQVEKGTLSELNGTEKIDLKMTMDAAVLLKVSSRFYLGRRALFPSLFFAMLRRQLGVRFSSRFMRAVLGF